MAERFASRSALAAKVEWEGGILGALDYGITADEMPEGDTELAKAWAEMASAYAQLEACMKPVEALLPDDPDDPSSSVRISGGDDESESG